MRDPARIPRILAEVQHVWSLYPDLRLGQLLVNGTSCFRNSISSFYIEDDELLEGLASLASLNKEHS